jgi:hypothetical protein
MLIEVKFPLLEVEDVQRFTVLQLLLVEITDAINGLFSLALLPDEHVAGIVQVRSQRARKGTVLDEGLRLLRPMTEDVCET